MKGFVSTFLIALALSSAAPPARAAHVRVVHHPHRTVVHVGVGFPVRRTLPHVVVRRLSLRLASWRALKRMPMAMPAMMTPAMATCLSYSDCRHHQRVQRWRVVETRGTVGVC